MPEQGRTLRKVEIAEGLEREITSGKLQPGARLPSESALMDMHGASRTTVRDALAILRDAGLTESRTGSGVYVRSHQPQRRVANERLAPGRWGGGRAVWETDERVRPEDVTVQEVPAPETIAATLGIPAGSPVILRTEVRRVDGRPVERSRSHVPAELIREDDRDNSEDPHVLLARTGHAPVHSREEVRGRMPAAIERSALGVPSGVPVLLLAATAFDSDDRPVEVVETLLDSSQWILEYKIRG